MLKKILFASIGLGVAGLASAAPLSPEEALARVAKGGGNRLAAKAIPSTVLQKTIKTSKGTPAVYLFANSKSNSGFMIVSADDATLPLLGYADKGTIDPENMAPGFKYWIEEYARQIEYITNNTPQVELGEETVVLPDWAPVDPLIKTQWDQDAPYNNLCPALNGVNCYTGCVATSMAQVMKYYNYPEKGRGSITYTPTTMNARLTMDFSEAVFDYDNMLNNYVHGKYNATQANAVATLMKACGYSVEMSYSTSVSGALSSLIAAAMIDYFDYDADMNYIDRNTVTYDEWAAMIYENLAAGMPIIYDATAPASGGHSFICDGYDGDGYFHINWGWDGMSDGYYALDALSPTAIGIGGYAGGFIFDQDALLGIRPNAGSEVEYQPATLVQHGALFGEINNSGDLVLGLKDTPLALWAYIGQRPAVLSFGATLAPVDDPNGKVMDYTFTYYKNAEFEPGYGTPYNPGASYTPKVKLSYLSMEDGVKYKVTAATKDRTDPDQRWMPVETTVGFPNYCYVTKNGDTYTVENVQPLKLNAANVEFLSTLYAGCAVKMKATISNDTDVQLSRGVSLALLDANGKLRYTGTSFLLTLDPDESVEQEWTSIQRANGNEITATTTLYAYIYDEENDIYYNTEGIEVTMEPNPGSVTLIPILTLEDAKRTENGYMLTDSHNIGVNLNLRVSRGYFYYPITMYILEARANSNYLTSLISKPFEEIPFLDVDESMNLSMVMDFPNPNPGQTYYMQSGYRKSGSTVWMNNQTIITFEDTDVESLVIDNGIKFFHDQPGQELTIFAPAGFNGVNAYWMNGQAAALEVADYGDKAVVNLSNLGKGILLIQATDKAGNVESMKLAL